MDSVSVKAKFGLARSAMLITVITAVSFVGSLVFHVLLARSFGTKWGLDAFVGASTLPFLFVSVVGALVEKTFIPLALELRSLHDFEEISRNILSNILTFALAVGLAVVFLAPAIVNISLPGFSDATKSVTINLLRILILFMLTGAMVSLLNGVYYAENRLLLPNLAPLLRWGVAILSVAMWNRELGIYSVGIGLSVGMLVQFAVLYCVRFGISVRIRPNFSHPMVKKLVKLMLPLVGAHAFSQLTLFLMRGIASQMGEGSVATLEFAYKVVYVAVFFVTQGISISAFPVVSQYASERSMEKVKALFVQGQRIVFLLTVPVIVVLLMLREPIVQILFERGAFEHRATLATAQSLLGFGGSILGFTMGTLQGQVYYSLQKAKWLFLIAGINMVLFGILAVPLNRLFPLMGIALAFSISALVTLWINSIDLARRLGIRRDFSCVQFVVKVGLASVLMWAGILLWSNAVSISQRWISLGLSGLIGVAIYAVCVRWIMKVEESKIFTGVLSQLFLPKYATRP